MIVPDPSLSMSAIMRLISSFLGSNPRARMATYIKENKKVPMNTNKYVTLSSLASIVPVPSVSNKSNASFISCFCSSVSSTRGPEADVYNYITCIMHFHHH